MSNPGNKKKKKKSKGPLIVAGMLALGIVAGGIAGTIGFNKLYTDPQRAAEELQRKRDAALPDQETIAEHKSKLQQEKDAEAAKREAENKVEYPEKITLLEAPPKSLTDCVKVRPTSADATSVIEQKGINNSADMTIDGKEDSSWQEGVAGDGLGQELEYKFSDKKTIRYMAFKLGNWSSDKYYDKNNRPKTIEIQAGKYTEKVTFPDGKEEFWVAFPEDCRTDEITLTIKEVYKGSAWQDTCIAEVTMYGARTTMAN